MINPDSASYARPSAGKPRIAVPGYVPWLVRVPVVLNLGFIFLSFAMFLYAMVRLGMLQGEPLDRSLFQVLAVPLVMMGVTAAVNFVLLFFVWRYSRIACGLLVLFTLLGLGWTGASVMRTGGLAAQWMVLVPMVVRLALDLAAFTGTFLYHASARRPAGVSAAGVIGE